VTAQQPQGDEREHQARERTVAEQRVASFHAEGRIKVDATILHGDSEAAKAGWFKPGAGKSEWFKDLDNGPEMVVVAGDPAFAIGRFALTFAEWDAAQAHPEWQKHSGISPRKPNDYSWGRGKQPAIGVSWNDAKAYCAWLSAVAAKNYRLPSEAEWEHACRAGTKTEFWWGNEISTAQANYNGNYILGVGKKGEYRRRTITIDNFDANAWGLYQVHGNVWEWCEDAYKESFRVVRGGSWFSFPGDLRSSDRGWNELGHRNNLLGFRVARVLSPACTHLTPLISIFRHHRESDPRGIT
jgi:formylglycine-generating enzyme required for sulfatase activity